MKSLLLDDFFKINEIIHNEDNHDRLTAGISLNPNHEIYNGHFPGNPVVPGVCLIQIIREVLSEHFCKELTLVKADEAKFMNMINPQLSPDLILDIKIKHTGDELLHVGVTINYNEVLCVKFRGSYR